MFVDWTNNFDSKIRNIALLGAAATVWSLWLYRNDIVFEKNLDLLLCRLFILISIDCVHWLCSSERICWTP